MTGPRSKHITMTASPWIKNNCAAQTGQELDISFFKLQLLVFSVPYIQTLSLLQWEEYFEKCCRHLTSIHHKKAAADVMLSNLYIVYSIGLWISMTGKSLHSVCIPILHCPTIAICKSCVCVCVCLSLLVYVCVCVCNSLATELVWLLVISGTMRNSPLKAQGISHLC